MKDKNESEVEQLSTPAGTTMEQLLKMFIEASKEQSKSNRELAASIENSRKPYVDPRVIADREQRNRDRKALVEMELRNRVNAKKYCSHLNEGGTSNIKWHQHSNGIILGVNTQAPVKFSLIDSNPEMATRRKSARLAA